MRMPGLAVPESVSVVDLFAGCGGFTQGFHEFRVEGQRDDGPVFHSIAAVEHDAPAAATYAANFGSSRPHKALPEARVHVGDIEEWEPGDEALSAEVVVGGPPCQGFSALNRHKKGAERNRLWDDYVRVVTQVRPKIFVIENVDRFLKSDEFGDLLREIGHGGRLSDYRLVDPPGHQVGDSPEQKVMRYVLNAADYGAPQARRRAIVMGVRNDLDIDRVIAYPRATHARPARKAVAGASFLAATEGADEFPPSWRGVRAVFEESSRLALRGTELPDDKEHIAEVNAVVPGIFTTRDLHFGRNPELLSIARYLAIPPGGNRKDLANKWFTVRGDGSIETFDSAKPPGVKTPVRYLSTESWDKHRTGTGDVMGRLRIDDPSVTIRTEFFKPEKGRYLHPTEPRPITHYEAARIQGFPLDFRWCGSKTDIARQIGNAVPIPLGKAIAGAIHAYLRG